MNRYNALTGSFERIPEAEPIVYQPSPGFIDLEGGENRKPSGQSGILGGLGGMLSGLGGSSGGLGKLLGGATGGLGSILGGLGGRTGGLGSVIGGLGGRTGGIGSLLSRFSLSNLELEDIMLVAFLYLLYRESGDVEFLLIAGAMLFL